MSNLVFPTLAGFGIEVVRTAIFATLVQPTPSGKELRLSYQATPRWRYEIPLNFARVTGFSINTPSNEMAQILSLFGAVKGRWDSFLFIDSYSNTAAAQNIGTGTGLAGQTTQIDDIEGFPISDFNGTPAIYVNGVLQTVTTNYTINASGLITWVTNPGNGLAITWTGAYYRRVRFDMDEMPMTQMFNLCWNGGTLKLLSVK